MAKSDREKCCRDATADVLQQAAVIAAKGRDRPELLIPILQQVQVIAGNSIPHHVAQVVAREMRLPLARIYGVETFYSFFSSEKRGKVIIRLCKSAPCHLKGAPGVLAAFEQALGIKVGETTADGNFTLETCECIGACDVSPAALIDGVVHGHLTPDKVKDLVSSLGEEVKA